MLYASLLAVRLLEYVPVYMIDLSLFGESRHWYGVVLIQSAMQYHNARRIQGKRWVDPFKITRLRTHAHDDEG